MIARDPATFNLSSIPESGLLDLVRLILSQPGEMTAGDREELEAINREFERREPGRQRAYKREKMRQYRKRDKLKEALKNGNREKG